MLLCSFGLCFDRGRTLMHLCLHKNGRTDGARRQTREQAFACVSVCLCVSVCVCERSSLMAQGGHSPIVLHSLRCQFTWWICTCRNDQQSVSIGVFVAGGSSTSLSTKLSMMWEARVGHSGVSARDAERSKASSIFAMYGYPRCFFDFSFLSKLGEKRPRTQDPRFCISQER